MKCKKCGKEVEVTHDGLCLSCYMTRPAGNPCEFDPERHWAVDSDRSRRYKAICTSPHESDRDCVDKLEGECTLKGECNWKEITLPDSANKIVKGLIGHE